MDAKKLKHELTMLYQTILRDLHINMRCKLTTFKEVVDIIEAIEDVEERLEQICEDDA